MRHRPEAREEFVDESLEKSRRTMLVDEAQSDRPREASIAKRKTTHKKMFVGRLLIAYESVDRFGGVPIPR